MNDTPNITLLIADDDPSHLLLCEAALAGAGFLVHTACDGQEAVERFPQVNPDVVVLDVTMPRLTGIEACRQIRKAAGQRLLPILMLTGRNDLQAISEAFAAGASDFAQKGMNPRLLVERVRFLLRDRALQEELRASRAKLLLAQRIARVGHWELAVDGCTLHASPMVGELLGRDAAELTGYDCFVKLLDSAERVAARQAFVTCATGNGGFGLDHRIRAADGSVICVHQEAELVEAPSGTGDPVVIVTLQDLTRLHHAEETVRMLSYFDTVSNLPNRRHLEELQVAGALAEPAGAVATAVVTFRVHGFDRVAQARGDEFATRLVVRLARRIETELERFNQGGTILWRADLPSVCRTADDELSLLLRSRVSAEHVATVVHGILEAVASLQPEAEVDYVPAISAGVALAESGVDAAQLISNAHAAAESAVAPRSCALFSPMPQAQMRRRLHIESSLRTALERRELQLVYQPRVAFETMELTGVECLVRWDHPQFGTIRPDEFIAIAEESGVIVDIGRWMIEEAARQVAAWRERYEIRFFAAASVTSRQLRDPRLQSMVLVALDRHRLPFDGLQVEVSEAGLADAPEAAQAALKSLRAKGVRIGLDDFGTGHSSLGQVRRLPFNSLKLDRSLVADLYSDPWAQGVTAAVLAMARAMQIRTVADGIDDPATLEMLHALGCDELQGLHVAPPMKPLDFEDWLERGGARHLARRRAGPGRDLPELPDSAVEDIMKWGNG